MCCNYFFVAKYCVRLKSEEEREWFSSEYEKLSKEELENSTKISLAKELIRSQAFDNFLAKRFSSVKRYGGEGAESMLGFFNEIFQLAANGSNTNLIFYCIKFINT